MRTSVNLQISDIPELLEACEKCQRGHSEIICLCLRKYFASHSPRLLASFLKNLVEYQPDGAGYKIVNLFFDVDVYNLAVCFRVFCRLSVSKMVTIALNSYLEDVVNELLDGGVVHNYVDYEHEVTHNFEQNCPKWQVTWNVSSGAPKRRPVDVKSTLRQRQSRKNHG